MNENTDVFVLDKYEEKINSVGYKLNQAVGHPEEQMRLLMQLKVYVNSMVEDLIQVRDVAFEYRSFEFQAISRLYDLTYGILTSITSVTSGMTFDVTGSDTDVVLTKDDTKDAVIQKFKLILGGGIDKVMRYLMTLNKPVTESSDRVNIDNDKIKIYDQMIITDEASTSYKIMRKIQTNSVALTNQLIQQKALCAKKYKESYGQTDLEEQFRNWLNKNKRSVQRKINGKEIKNKHVLQKFINLYDTYLNKLGGIARESTIYSDLGVCEESYNYNEKPKFNYGQAKLESLDNEIRRASTRINKMKSKDTSIEDRKKLKEEFHKMKLKYEDQYENIDQDYPDDKYSTAFITQYKIKLEKLISLYS